MSTLYKMLLTLYFVVVSKLIDTSVHGTDVNICSNLCKPYGPYYGCKITPREADQCGCDPACEHYGDCCYDYKSTCSPSNTTVPLANQLECISQNNSTQHGLYAVSFCNPKSNVDIRTITKCENPGTGDVMLTVIVSDAKDNIYKNVYCALCNKVPITEITAWNMDYICKDEQVKKYYGLEETGEQQYLTTSTAPSIKTSKDSNISDNIQKPRPTAHPIPIHKNLDEYCEFTRFTPPYGKRVTRRRCTKAISECNENYKNITIIEACMTKYKAIVYEYPNCNVYLNPHCAICNNVPDYTCYNPCGTTNIEIGRPVQDNTYGLTPLTLTVDFQDNTRISVKYGSYEYKEITCISGQMFDSNTKQCVELKCRNGFILKDDRCIASSTSSDCQKTALHVKSEIFCECKMQKQSLRIDFEYQDYNSNMISVDEFKENLNSKGIQYIEESMNSTSMTVKSILIEGISCQIVYDISELLTTQINNKTDSQLNVVTLWQNCSTKAIPSELHCDYDSLLLTAGEELYYDNGTRTIRAGNSSTQIPDNEYVLELVHTLGNESSVCSSLSMLTCEVCAHVQLASTAFQDEGNGTLMYRTTGDVFGKHKYLFSDSSNTSMLVCSFLNQTGTTIMNTQFFHYSGHLFIVSVVCTILSLIGLFITILLRIFIADLRTLSGNIILNVSIALFLALLLTLIQGNFTKWTALCTTVAGILHYLWLVGFFWMNAMAFELYKTFRIEQSSSRSSRSKRSQHNSFKKYFIYSWGFPMIYVGAIITLSELTNIGVTYGDNSICWIRDELASFYVFGIPLALILIPNLILFVATIRGIHKSMKSAKEVRSEKSDQKRAGEMIIYIRISSVMGLTWILGFLAAFTDQILLWYLFTILNSLQGLFIFVAFNLTHSMKNMLKSLRKNETSTQPKSKETSLLQENKNVPVLESNINYEAELLRCTSV